MRSSWLTSTGGKGAGALSPDCEASVPIAAAAAVACRSRVLLNEEVLWTDEDDAATVVLLADIPTTGGAEDSLFDGFVALERC